MFSIIEILSKLECIRIVLQISTMRAHLPFQIARNRLHKPFRHSEDGDHLNKALKKRAVSREIGKIYLIENV